ncbi:hypothetical protein [Acidisphaera sp. S103]|uniref:hypothetical protein n=1 Tax=Acidisphaera sp. S103 TaxID=1747223 RepID=UPI00131D6226|nr:hypothetical protein [Acidisphaera sp. S103]
MTEGGSLRFGGTSRMMREYQVRICERLGVRLPGPTRQRDRLVVIVAGYPEQMEMFLMANPGLPSRFTKTISFESYNADELVAIMHSTARRDGLRLDEASNSLLKDFFVGASQRSDFGNARTARTLLERAREAQAVRIAPFLEGRTVDLNQLTPIDIETAIAAMS